MNVNPNVAEVASLLSEPSRATILTSLMDGRFHTASGLAQMANIKRQTASYHLAKLVQSRFVIVEKHGRFRYYQLANREVAHILESLLVISRPAQVLKQSDQSKKLRHARMCYDHVAGRLGVELTQSMLNAGYLIKRESEFLVTHTGEQFLTDFGLDLAMLRKKRAVIFPCMPSTRAIQITDKGKAGLKQHFHLSDL